MLLARTASISPSLFISGAPYDFKSKLSSTGTELGCSLDYSDVVTLFGPHEEVGEGCAGDASTIDKNFQRHCGGAMSRGVG